MSKWNLHNIIQSFQPNQKPLVGITSYLTAYKSNWFIIYLFNCIQNSVGSIKFRGVDNIVRTTLCMNSYFKEPDRQNNDRVPTTNMQNLCKIFSLNSFFGCLDQSSWIQFSQDTISYLPWTVNFTFFQDFCWIQPTKFHCVTSFINIFFQKKKVKILIINQFYRIWLKLLFCWNT